MKSLFLSLIAILLSAATALSQDISKYLDDGVQSKGSNIVSIGYDPLNAVIPVCLEHHLVSRLSLVVGGGPVWLKKVNVLSPDDPLPIKQEGIGYSAFIKAKVYFHAYPERLYTAIYPRLTVMDDKLFIDIAPLNFGYQRILFQRLMISAEAGFGFRFFKHSLEDTYNPFLVPASINIGYLF